VSEWIDAFERKPAQYESVLIACAALPGWIPPTIAFWTGTAWHDDVSQPALMVSHWMALPKTPSAG
jgi:hypothetical protein